MTPTYALLLTTGLVLTASAFPAPLLSRITRTFSYGLVNGASSGGLSFRTYAAANSHAARKDALEGKLSALTAQIREQKKQAAYAELERSSAVPTAESSAMGSVGESTVPTAESSAMGLVGASTTSTANALPTTPQSVLPPA